MRAHAISALLAFGTAAQAVALPGAGFEVRATCNKNDCLSRFQASSSAAKAFCSTYTKTSVTSLPSFAAKCSKASRISSACSCINSAPTTTKSSVVVSVATSTPAPTSTPAISTPDISTSAVSTPAASSSTAAVSSEAPVSSAAASSATPTTVSASADACYVTEYSAVPAATASCTAITLDGITVPGNSTLDLSKLKTGTKVTFAGLTFWEYADANYPLIKVGGTDIELTAEEGAILDGNGQSWWDGLGSNGGIAKPNHFIELSKLLGKSIVHGIYIQNYPVHCFSISNCAGLDIYDITLNNSAGYAPNNRSAGLPASHNSDGFDLASCNDTTVRDSVVINQDDCVAVTSGNNILVNNMYCNGSHGLSIGSVGGKTNNNVTNIKFSNSVVLNSENGARIKTNSNTTGFISNITFENIRVENISIYGIDIQQDYLNGGPTGSPTNGVIIQNITMKNITGTATEDGRDYYILCGDGSCSNFEFDDIDIRGGGVPSSCNFQPTGDFDCLDH